MVIFHSYVSLPEGTAMWCNIRCNIRAESAWAIWRFQTLGGSPLANTRKKKTQTVLIGQMKVDPVGMWVKADFIPLTFRIHHPKAKHSKPQLETGHGPWLSG